ncbi:MAG: DUF4147 domain-containing protein [Deltaproteobacteria bacterium]
MIKNREELLSHGFIAGREKALDIVEYALAQVNPRNGLKKHVTLEGESLHVGKHVFDLRKIEHIYAVGAGKATYLQAVALEEILGERITNGFIAVKEGQKGTLSRIRMAESAHPVPDARSLQAAQEILSVAGKAGKHDLVFCLMSGGVSAQAVFPVPEISLADKIEVNRLLVHSGADVTEIMTVRRHLSRIKGGRFAERILPATIVAAGGSPVYNHMIVKVRELWEAAVGRAKEMGLRPVLLTTSMNGESREVGRTLSSIAREIHRSGNPIKPPCVLIGAGETAVRMESDASGEGGANQELAAGACLGLQKDDPIAICAIDTDGTDGPTGLAGALTDGSTEANAAKRGHDVFKGLMEHDISPVLREVGDAIITGQTGTNVNDLAVIVVL